MHDATTTINIDSKLAAPAQKVFSEIGMDLTTAITIFLNQSVLNHGFPFEIKKEIPNQTTIDALNEFYEMKKHPEKYKKYSSFKEALKEALADA